jgi:IS605 OrfB family transposase
LVHEGIGTLVIGKNPFWKQGVALGKKHNQEFVQLPHATFIEMLTYKAESVGMTVLITEESYSHPFRCQWQLQHQQKSIPDSLRWSRDRGHGSSAQTACRLNYRAMADLS